MHRSKVSTEIYVLQLKFQLKFQLKIQVATFETQYWKYRAKNGLRRKNMNCISKPSMLSKYVYTGCFAQETYKSDRQLQLDMLTWSSLDGVLNFFNCDYPADLLTNQAVPRGPPPLPAGRNWTHDTMCCRLLQRIFLMIPSAATRWWNCCWTLMTSGIHLFFLSSIIFLDWSLICDLWYLLCQVCMWHATMPKMVSSQGLGGKQSKQLVLLI